MAAMGQGFHAWVAATDSEPYHSWGNGSAMRVSAVGFALDTLDQVLKEARAHRCRDPQPSRRH
jgi:ADP-ribosyl-[dinitrogen reductase] hydrolase